MAVKTIAWESGGGYITLTYTGTGNGTISVKSDANETFNDRQQYVSIATTVGSPQKAVNMLIKQKGKNIPAGTRFDFAYTGTVQEVTLPPGKYKLQCWGAQGGNSSSYNGVGSKGGYSEGVLTLKEITTLYVFVGGKGGNGNSTSMVNGGWNGGGGSVGKSSYNSGDTYGISYPACGGGATDIATVTSGMSYSNYRTNRSNASLLSRCIVAGGGAGASARYTKVTSTSIGWDSGKNYKFDQYYKDSSVGRYIFLSSAISVPVGTKCRIYNISCPTTYDYHVNAYGASAGESFISSTEFTIPAGTTSIRVVLQTHSVESEGFSPTAASFDFQKEDTITSTDTSSSKSNSSQQGGGTSGRGTSPGTQTGGGGSFGAGANQTTTNYRYDSGAGGGGWYGGGSSHSDTSASQINSSGGGSGFVNTAANAGNRPSGYTGLQLDSGTTTAGNSSFPSTSGGTETGHSGNGYARITVLNPDGTDPGGGGTGSSASITWQTRSGTWNESEYSPAADGKKFTCVSPGSSGSTVLRCTFSGVSSIKFRCRYQGESNYDYLTVGAIDTACTRSSYGTSLKGTSGTWKEITYDCYSGEHYVEFCYSKDGSVDNAPDNAEVYITEYS